jgi:hypothetical protein
LDKKTEIQYKKWLEKKLSKKWHTRLKIVTTTVTTYELPHGTKRQLPLSKPLEARKLHVLRNMDLLLAIDKGIACDLWLAAIKKDSNRMRTQLEGRKPQAASNGSISSAT